MFGRLIGAAAIVAITLTGAANAADTVKFGSIRVPVQVFVGMDKGFFAEENITIEPVFYKSGAEIAPAVATGQVDAAITTSGAALFNAMARGANLTIVAEAASLELNAPGGDQTAIVVRSDLIKSGKVKTAADLKGRTMAVTAPGQILDIIVKTYLETHGIKQKDITTVSMPMPDMVPAMSNGAIDAAIVLDPFRSLLVDSGQATVLVTASEVLPNASQAFVTFSQDFMKKRDLAVRFVRAYVKSNQWMRKSLPTPEGRSEIAAIYQKYIPLQDASIYKKIALGTATEEAKVNVDGKFGLKWQLQTLIDLGLIRNAPKLEDHLDFSILADATKK